MPKVGGFSDIHHKPHVPCTPTKRARVVRMHDNENMTFAAIAKEFNMSRQTVQNHYRDMKTSGDPYKLAQKKRKRGRPPRFNQREVQAMIDSVDSGQARDGVDVRNQLFPAAPARTVQDILTKNDRRGYVRRKTPYLSQYHIDFRLAWAQDKQGLSVDDWRIVWFSDESKFNLFGSDGRMWCCRPRGKDQLADRNTKKVIKHGGGSVMVWGCITPFGPGRLVRIEGKMDAKMYIDVLKEGLLGTMRHYGVTAKQFVFQRDNDPKHASRAATAWTEEEGIEVLEWPASSPDMSAVENPWDELDDRVRRRRILPKNKEEMWEALQEEWYGLPQSYIDKLYESMPRRIDALVKAKGRATKY